MRRRLVVALVALAACGGGDADDAGDAGDGAGIVVRDAWTRPTPATAAEAAVYLRVENRDDAADELLGARSDRCLTVQVHRTTVDDNGVAVMSEVGAGELVLAPDEELALEPNGVHLMCSGLSTPFVDGETAELTLVFLHHDPVTVPLAVENR